jgi:hypothetical protein
MNCEHDLTAREISVYAHALLIFYARHKKYRTLRSVVILNTQGDLFGGKELI